MSERPGGLEPAQPWRARAQVVGGAPPTGVDGKVEVAVVLPTPDGLFRHRRIVCSSKDLAAGMPDLLFDPEPDPALLRARAASRVRTLRDQAFDTFEAALESAQTADPPADPGAWMDAGEFHWEVVDDGSAIGSGPEDQDFELLGVVIGIMVGMSAASLWMFAAFWVDDRLGLNTPEGTDSMWDNVLGFFGIVIGFWLTWRLAVGVPALLAGLIRPIRLRPEPWTVCQYAADRHDLNASSDAPPVPQTVRVAARTRNVFLAGWLTCGVIWVVAGAVAQVVAGAAGLVAFCLATGLVMCAVGVRGHQRGLVADPGGITIRNFLRHVRIPWGELRWVQLPAELRRTGCIRGHGFRRPPAHVQ